MTFNSVSFFAFFPLAVLVCWLVPRRWQNAALLAVSYAFYCFNTPAWLPVLVLDSLATWALVRRMADSGLVDAVGLNCVSAPGAMRTLVQQLGSVGIPLSVMPNAGYPVVTRTQVQYRGKPDYFASELARLAAEGVRILGGCCGTTPAHIAALRKALAALPGSLTVFIVSQRAASLQHADQILVLDDGRLVGLGPHRGPAQGTGCPAGGAAHRPGGTDLHRFPSGSGNR